MLYPRGICLFPPLPPSPPFTKLAYTWALHSKSRADGSGGREEWGGGNGEGEWGGGNGGVGEEEERSLSLLVDLLPLFPTKKPGFRLAQNANAQRLVWIVHKN